MYSIERKLDGLLSWSAISNPIQLRSARVQASAIRQSREVAEVRIASEKRRDKVDLKV